MKATQLFGMQTRGTQAVRGPALLNTPYSTALPFKQLGGVRYVALT